MVTRRRRDSWSTEEEELLIENIESSSIKELMELLPDRTKKAINRKIEKLRAAGKIGYKKSDAVKRSFYQRGKELR